MTRKAGLSGSDNDLWISVVDAGRRQLETAIRLFFEDGDLPSIHTLGCAAHEILERSAKSRGEFATFLDQMTADIRPEFRKEWVRTIRKAQNFLKHANPSERPECQLVPLYTFVVLLDACWTFKAITKARNPAMNAYEVWAGMTWARDFVSYDGLDPDSPAVAEVVGRGPRDFFTKSLAASL